MNVAQIVAIVLAALLAFVFIASGVSKVVGVQWQVKGFAHYGYPQWFRVVTGLIEIVGAIGLLVGIFVHVIGGLAGVLIAITMLGAVVTHIRVKDPVRAMSAAIVLLILALVVVALRFTVSS